MGKRSRKNYLKGDREPIYPIYFDDRFPIKPITIIEEKPIEIEGVKPGSYTANNVGQVFNNKGEIIKPNKINSGYYSYRLVTGNKKGEGPKYKYILAHRLFMDVFDPIENPKEFTVNHINMNKVDNQLSNLERISQKENNEKRDQVIMSGGVNHYRSIFTLNDIRVILDGFDKGYEYSLILKSIGKEDTKVNRDYIGNIKRGITYKREVKMILNEKAQRLSDKE